MKVGIITINDFNNYGNRLQNYAVQQILKKYNIDSYSLLYNIRTSNNKRSFILNYIKDIIRPYKSYANNSKRKNNFKEFNKFIKFGNKITVKSSSRKYDYYITGSDQVWNPNFRLYDIDLLSFVCPNKRISFSASFGVDRINSDAKEKCIKELPKFKKISVREEAGKKIIFDICPDLKVDVLIDPTLMLNSNEWENIMKKPKGMKKGKYILTYFLGDVSNERLNIIKKYAQEESCEIIDISKENSEFFCAGPSEFLYLEKNAYLICTDSFHSSVFSIIFNRPFVIFDRVQKGVENMNSRLETLLNKFEIKDRKFDGKLSKKCQNCDYTKAYEILEKEKNKVYNFLIDALNMEDKK